MDYTTKKILIVDLGSSSIRFFLMDENRVMTLVSIAKLDTEKLKGNIVTIDAGPLQNIILDHMSNITNTEKNVCAVAITNQRASTIVYDKTLRPLEKAISWQDFRSVGRCMALSMESDIHLAPNHSATKIETLLNLIDKKRDNSANYKVGTLDNYIAAVLSEGHLHVSDLSNASLTGLIKRNTCQYDPDILKQLNIPFEILPDLVDSIRIIGYATALPGSPPIAAILGDQQASLIGQGCIDPLQMKATFGTGAMVDINTGTVSRYQDLLGPHGCTEIVAYKTPEACTYAIEAIGLSAGSVMDWLCHNLRLINDPAETDEIARKAGGNGGVCFVPAQQGLGTPIWDFGAKGIITGIGPSTDKAEIIRAVLEGIANSGVDLIDAAMAEAGTQDNSLPISVDGGMTANNSFLQLLADLAYRPVHVAHSREATAYGAGLAALVAIGHYNNLKEATAGLKPSKIIDPTKKLDRQRWLEARSKAEKNVPALSAIKFH